MSKGVITKISGPLVVASGMRDANMFDVVRVSNSRLIGEIIEMHGDRASVQVYEERESADSQNCCAGSATENPRPLSKS